MLSVFYPIVLIEIATFLVLFCLPFLFLLLEKIIAEFCC